MSSSFFKYFIYFTLIIILFISIFSIPILSSSIPFENSTTNTQTYSLTGYFQWPTPGFTRITSPFGYRKAPTGGASTYHSGIDIGAPTGSNIISIFPGKVTLTEFKGAGGFTITIVNENFSASYCHVSPDFIVHVGQIVAQGQVIGKVGPKNVYGIIGNPYKDSNGNPTNGATTGPHLHLTIRKDGELVNPLDYL